MRHRPSVAGLCLVLWACSDSGNDPASSLTGTVKAVVIGAMTWGGPQVALSGVRVTIDGRTSVTVDGVAYLNQVRQGLRDVHFERVGSVPQDQQVTVFAGDTTESLAALDPVRPDTGSIQVIVNRSPPSPPFVPGASVTIAGTSGITDSFGTVVLSGLPAGEQSVHVERSGYVPFDGTVTVVGGETRNLWVSLVPVPAQAPTTRLTPSAWHVPNAIRVEWEERPGAAYWRLCWSTSQPRISSDTSAAATLCVSAPIEMKSAAACA